MIKHFISKIKENLAELDNSDEFEKIDSLVVSNKGMLDSIEIIKNDCLGHYSFNTFRKEIDSYVK